LLKISGALGGLDARGNAKLFHHFDDEHFDGPPGTETEQIILTL
jgi:hypothetical protein